MKGQSKLAQEGVFEGVVPPLPRAYETSEKNCPEKLEWVDLHKVIWKNDTLGKSDIPV